MATDVVGRGIDVSGISHFVNYDIPINYDIPASNTPKVLATFATAKSDPYFSNGT